MRSALKKALKESVNGVLSFNKCLKDHTTFRIGGIPRIWLEPASLEDLRRALRILSETQIKPFLIGNGSNILLSDSRIDKAVIRLSAPCFKRLGFGKGFVICGSGCNLSGLIKRCMEKGLSGLEGLAGIPGTVGGAIAVNASGMGKNNIGDLVEWLKVIDYKGRRVSLLRKDRLRFKYRDSGLSGYIMLEAKFALKRRSPGFVKREFRGFLQKKLAAQEYRFPNAGCIFKNPRDSRLTSGQILERCGLKGLKIRDAQVSTRHANFIINRGNARFADVMSLIKLEMDIVEENFGIRLEPEIKIIK